ncbi:class I SAM-dependent DNA methyltransferase, partial [Kocuria rhizophila]|uniref:class I SAM-dependent DNA methyltransferase n=3 Tax=Kocuria rhizophila TaxID=72000 RepID=UPI00387A5EE0
LTVTAPSSGTTNSATERYTIIRDSTGSGFAGHLLTGALESTGVRVSYRGQEISHSAVSAARRRFEASADAVLVAGNTLEHDEFDDFPADLVIVDGPWGMSWESSAPRVNARRESGAFGFGLPQKKDSTWLFISLALEKLRPSAEGGGRVAALVTPHALSSGGASGAVRQKIVDAGLLESVTRLPDGLAPTTSIPLYLVTFSNRAKDARRGKAMIADLRTEFTTERRCRSMPVAALRELESGLRSGKPGPRNRNIPMGQFTRRNARLERVSAEGKRLRWPLTTYGDTPIDSRFLETRYGLASGVTVVGSVHEIVDLDPGRIFANESRELLKDIEAKGWPARRLSSLIACEPELLPASRSPESDGHLFVPTTLEGKVAGKVTDTPSGSRILSLRLDDEAVDVNFLTAWLNSEQGILSRRWAIQTSSSGRFTNPLWSAPGVLMQWADELIVPVPDHSTQLALASADKTLASFEAELEALRESVWASPDSAEEVVDRIAGAFDESFSSWLDQLPFPVASALWTAETAKPPGEQQRAYIHAWEAIVTFHATVLLSASRTDLGQSGEVEAAIRRALHDQHLSIERASFGTWVIIVERVTKEIRRALEDGDADEVARVRRAFGGLSRTGIERLISKRLVMKFNEVNRKRNRWLGHTGYTSEDEWKSQVLSLRSDLSELRQILGNVWTHLLLVRAGSSQLRRDGRLQAAEVVVGTRSPFVTQDFRVGEEMVHGDLYLVRDGSESPLRLGHFVQLRAAPSSAQYTTYFYNRTEGARVRMVSYQYGPDSEVQDDLQTFLTDFGALAMGEV